MLWVEPDIQGVWPFGEMIKFTSSTASVNEENLEEATLGRKESSATGS